MSRKLKNGGTEGMMYVLYVCARYGIPLNLSEYDDATKKLYADMCADYKNQAGLFSRSLLFERRGNDTF